MSLLQRFLDPNRVLRPLPPPHKSARVYDFAEAVVLHRNHETAASMSRELHNTRSKTT